MNYKTNNIFEAIVIGYGDSYIDLGYKGIPTDNEVIYHINLNDYLPNIFANFITDRNGKTLQYKSDEQLIKDVLNLNHLVYFDTPSVRIEVVRG